MAQVIFRVRVGLLSTLWPVYRFQYFPLALSRHCLTAVPDKVIASRDFETLAKAATQLRGLLVQGHAAEGWNKLTAGW